jgi:serine/threonine protein kinase
MSMTPEQWARVDAVLDVALDLPSAERAEYLDRACDGDAALRAGVERLLAAHEATDGPLPAEPATAPAALFAAPLVAHTLRMSPDDGEVAITPPGVFQPAHVGAWRIITPAGEGGMGTVYVAERDDGAFRMRAALKLVRRGLHFDPQFVRRFREERQILARLDHAGIARLIDGGITDDGLPYFVMEYVAGEAIDRWCDGRRLQLDARLDLFAKVCDAVAAAHRLGVVHRDLKPSNVLVTATGDPKLLDFGIAKTLSAGQSVHGDEADAAAEAMTSLTRTGERLLTPEYASPEQVLGAEVTAATDVYSLGVLLYELLTGRRPHAGEGRARHEVDRAVLEEPALRPSSAVTDRPRSRPGAKPLSGSAAELAAARGLEPAELRHRLRGDLDAIVLMSLRKEADRRYADAAELAGDIRRYLAGRPVRARGDAVTYRARSWLRRHQRLVGAAVAGMIVGIVALGLVSSRADRQLKSGDDAGAHGLVAHRYYDDGMRAYNRGNWADAFRLLASAVTADSTFALAALYASEAASRNEDYAARDEYLRHALRAAAFAPRRERLIVRAFEAYRLRLPTLRSYADSLLALDASDLEAQLADARADFAAGDFLGAVARNRTIVAADSAALRHGQGPCYACQALLAIVTAYSYADSTDAALREAVALTQLLPQYASSWAALAAVQQRLGTRDETAYRKVLELDPGDADYAAEWIADVRIRRGDFAAADEVLRARMQTAPARSAERMLWTLITSLRNQERWTDAMTLARQFRALNPAATPGSAPVVAVHEAQLLLESGHARASAALYDSISRFIPPEGGVITHRIWSLAHRADALAAAGDTTPLAAIADTIRALAVHSGHGRDQRLEHHVRGLLFVARGSDIEAVEAFQRAIYSWSLGYTRTNLALAGALLRLGRAREAVAALQPALRGSLEVNNLYVTHTVLHRALADAWLAGGDADSARVHAAWVRRAVQRR